MQNYSLRKSVQCAPVCSLRKDRETNRKTGERTDQTKIMTLILAFHNFANIPKNNAIEENIV